MKYTIKYDYDGFYKNGHIARIYDEEGDSVAHGMGYTCRHAKNNALTELKRILAKPEQWEPSLISAPNRSKFDNSFSARVMYLYNLMVGKDKQKS